MIKVLLIKKDDQENDSMNTRISKWQIAISEKTKEEVSITVLDKTTDLKLLITSGALYEYLIIFTPFIEGHEFFELMQQYLKHTIIFRVQDKVSEAYIPQNNHNGNVYPKFSVDILTPMVIDTVRIIRSKLYDRQVYEAQVNNNTIQSTHVESEQPSKEFINQLINGNGFHYEDEEDVENIDELENKDENELIGGPGNEEEDYYFEEDVEELDIEEKNYVIEDDMVEDDSVPFDPKNHLVHQSIMRSNYQRLNEKIDEAERDLSQRSHIDSEDSFFYERTRTIQKQLFSKQSWENHKTIGVWSPLHNKGVTTFTMNYAFFLAENRIFTGVLEGLNKESVLKHWLKRYTPIPKKWSSFSKTIHYDGEPSVSNWSYRNVLFLPLDDDDCTLEWNSETLEVYMSTPNLMDITLVDLPTGEMAPYTLDSLIYLDELWILVDDTYQEHLAWKEYIHLLHQKFKVDIKMIFNQKYEFSQVKRLTKEMDLDLIATLPSLHEEVMKNYYATEPLLTVPSVRESLYDGFLKLTQHLMGKDFQLVITKEGVNDYIKHETFWKNWRKKFTRWLKR